MDDITTKSTGDSLTAAEWNQIPAELENMIKSAGITLSGADLFQVAKAAADYASSGDAYTDTGAADAYVLTTIGLKQGIQSYSNLTRVRFEAGNANTGASTINVNGLGVKSIKTRTGTDPLPGQIAVGDIIQLEYDGADFILTSTIDALTGSFTATGVGFSGTAPTATWDYVLRDGVVTLHMRQLSGTSNAVFFRVTGLPALLFPAIAQAAPVTVRDNSTNDAIGSISIESTGLFNVYRTAITAWTASGVKALETGGLGAGGQTVVYSLG